MAMSDLVPYSSNNLLSPAADLGQMIPQMELLMSRLSRGAGRSVGLLPKVFFDKFHLMGEAGAGKSRFMGRQLCWFLLRLGWPQVILDPTGGTTDNLLDKIIRLPYRKDRVKCFERIIYVDMSGKSGYVMPFPLYCRLTLADSLFDVGQRFIEVIKRTDVHLANAPIMGFNALATIGTHAGMLLATLSHQITEAENLIRHPEEWEGQFERALSITPEVLPAVNYFRSLADAKDRDQQSRTFLVKILPFIAEPTTRAMFGASEPGLNWEEIVKSRKTVLLDFSRERDRERRRFKLLWCLRSLIEFAKLRGFAGRDQPFGLIVDEFTQLLGFGGHEENLAMAEDSEELISVVSRNYGVAPLCIAHQNLSQLYSERIQKAVMTMGTQMIGKQADPESSQLLAQYFYRYDPYKIKRYEPVWMSDMLSRPYVVDYRPIDFTLEEQEVLNKYDFMDLGQFEFMVRPALGEGDKGGKLRRISIAGLDPGIYPRAEWLAKVKQRFMQRDGRPISEVLDEIAARRQYRLTFTALPEPELASSDIPRWGK